jgi:hypothetical protein
MITDWKDLIPEISKRSGCSEQEVEQYISQWSAELKKSYEGHENWIHDFFRLGSIRLTLPYLRRHAKSKYSTPQLRQLYLKALNHYPEYYKEEIKKWHDENTETADETVGVKQA